VAIATLRGRREIVALSVARLPLEVLEVWRGRKTPPADSRGLIRAAMGFVDLAGKVMSVAKKPDNVTVDHPERSRGDNPDVMF
jgi:hypothetical protein